MIDPDVERRTADCTELMDIWRQFLDLVNKALKPPQSINPQMEQQFIQIKARIAMLHDSFMESLKHDKSVGTNMIEIVNRAITLRLVQKMGESEQKKMEVEWHEVFLLLNETVSTLNEERLRLKEVNEIVHNLKRLQEALMVRLKAFLSSIYFKIGAVLTVLIFIIWGIPALGIYDYDDLRDVDSLKPALASTFKFTRTTLGAPLPYMDMAQVLDELDKLEDVEGINKIDDVTKDITDPQATAADMIGYAVTPDYEKAAEYANVLKSAQEYVKQVCHKERWKNRTADVHMFWFRRTRDAKKFYVDMQGETIPDRIRIVRKANVIIVIGATDDELMDWVEERYIGELAG